MGYKNEPFWITKKNISIRIFGWTLLMDHVALTGTHLITGEHAPREVHTLEKVPELEGNTGDQ